jgi:nicotinamidase-related amidase
MNRNSGNNNSSGRKTALVIIDPQVNMFDASNPVHSAEAILQTLGSLIAQARSAGALVVYVQNNGGKGDPDQMGTAGWRIHPALAPQAGDLVLQKSTPDAFHGTPLQKELVRRGVERLVLTGMQTDHGIDATTRRAASIGYEVLLVRNGHSTHGTEKATAADVIANYNESLSAFAKVVDSNEIDFRRAPSRSR